ncbi:MAG TPA: hypothetical protein VK988_00665 [Acidimicrobiales bacterium]|nr:hypothetical protein [Acidimicrobiales bacterium]
MSGERYVLLGLAPARSSWFKVVAQWAHSGTIPAEFVKCLSVEELRARLASGRPFSAALVDARLSGLDRDLVDTAGRAGCAVMAVADHRRQANTSHGDWKQLGVAEVLPEYFDPKALLAALCAHVTMISRADSVPGESMSVPSPAWQGLVALVCGPGGTGASTAAIALSQGLAADPRHGRAVLLADLCLHAEQAMLHDARDVVPGVQELVEAHRTRRPLPEDVRALAFQVDERGYDLLLGLRQARAWSSIRTRAFEAAFASLRGAYRIVVADAGADLEGEETGGSYEVEERHVMSRTAASQADVVFAVGVAGMKGLHSLVRVLNDLRAFGVAPERVVPVVNRAPRNPRARAEITAAMAALTAPVTSPPGARASTPSPVFVPERRVDDMLRLGSRLPDALVQPLAGAFAAVASQLPPVAAGGPSQVEPGSLGFLDGEEHEEAALG